MRNLRKLATEYGESIAAITINLLNALKQATITDYNLQEFVIKPVVSGLDLNKAGLCEGRDIGLLLSALTLCLYEKPELNGFETLMQIAELIQQKFKTK
jgi:hypothetical protein